MRFSFCSLAGSQRVPCFYIWCRHLCVPFSHPPIGILNTSPSGTIQRIQKNTFSLEFQKGKLAWGAQGCDLVRLLSQFLTNSMICIENRWPNICGTSQSPYPWTYHSQIHGWSFWLCIRKYSFDSPPCWPYSFWFFCCERYSLYYFLHLKSLVLQCSGLGFFVQ